VAFELNERFAHDDDLHPQYFTMIYGTIDLHTGMSSLTQAGHPSPIHQIADGTARHIGDGGFPIGMVPGVNYDEHAIIIQPGERLFMYSDGITECLGSDDRTSFGLERLVEVIQNGRNAPLGEVMHMIETELKRFRGNSKFDDDVSLLALERLEKT